MAMPNVPHGAVNALMAESRLDQSGIDVCRYQVAGQRTRKRPPHQRLRSSRARVSGEFRPDQSGSRLPIVLARSRGRGPNRRSPTFRQMVNRNLPLTAEWPLGRNPCLDHQTDTGLTGAHGLIATILGRDTENRGTVRSQSRRSLSIADEQTQDGRHEEQREQ